MMNVAKNLIKNLSLAGGSEEDVKAFLADWQNSLKDSRAYYLAATKYFKRYLPDELQNHRRYYQQEMRGFGEEAFHTMWYLLYAKYTVNNFLEIGVYRGQTISLLCLLAKLANRRLDVYGISPFSSAGDGVSQYLSHIDYKDDTEKNFAHFSLPKPSLLKAYSTDDAAKELIAAKQWDAIYIDGSHDFDIVLEDWKICSRHVRKGGIIVMDDASHFTKAKLPFYAF